MRCLSCHESLRILNKLVEAELDVAALEGLSLRGPFVHEVFGSGLSATLADFVPPRGTTDVLVK